MKTDYTDGPLRVELTLRSINTLNQNGEIIFRRDWPCTSSRDTTVEERRGCVFFPFKQVDKCAEINERAIADEVLRASAPDLLHVLESLENDDNSIPEHAWKWVKDVIEQAKKKL